MSVIANNIVAGAAGQGGAEAGPYQIDRSLRFDSSASSHLSRTPSSAGNRTTWTWSGWVKRSKIDSSTSVYGLFGAYDIQTNHAYIIFYQDGIRISDRPPAGQNALLQTTQVFRDPSAWYHIVVAWDGSNSTSSDRVRLYVNGSRVTSFSTATYPTTSNSVFNSAIEHSLGRDVSNNGYFNGYLADVHFIDGQALDPTDFGEYDNNNNWNPKDVSGLTFGTNGFHLDFSDNSSNAALGYDSSGNNNDWTVNNLVAVPAGLSTANEGFDVLTYSGTGSSQSITGLNFQPDFVWIKRRNAARSHMLFDVVRGLPNRLASNETSGDNTDANNLNSFDSTGFTTSTGDAVNGSGGTYVAWCWKAGGTASSNTDGTITSSVSPNTTYGFSVVTYTGNGTAGATVGHGLSATPAWYIVKRRNASAAWYVYHKDVTTGKVLILNATDAENTSSFTNSTEPTSSVFSLGSASAFNHNGGTFVAYCWSEVSGFSKFGSYSGNGSTQKLTFGFKPAYVIIKRTDSSTGGDWFIFDYKRVSGTGEILLRANTTGADNAAYDYFSFDADGITLATGNTLNGSGRSYIYAAFASKPDESVIDSLIDTPTNYESAVGNAGGNYCTLNPLDKGSGPTLANGNLDVTGTAGVARGTMFMPSGKWYFEGTLTALGNSGNNTPRFGVANAAEPIATSDAGSSNNVATIICSPNSTFGGRGIRGGTTVGTGNPFAAGDVAMVAYDADTGNIWFGKNGTWINSGNPATGASPTFTGLTAPYAPLAQTDPAGFYCNFGQRPFAYTPPTGFKSLCTQNLPDPTIADGSTAMDAVTYTGNGSTQSITGLNFSPEFLWFKSRGSTRAHHLIDVVRGAGKRLYSNLTNAEDSTVVLTSFDSNGFSVTAANGSDGINATNDPMVAWTWDGGTSTATNTDGSITSNVRANASAGFSIVTYTGNGTAASVGSGLNVPADFIILKNRFNTTYGSWKVYHKDFTATYNGELNTTAAPRAYGGGYVYSSTSGLIQFATSQNYNEVNISGNSYVAYCFAPVAGYSAFGSYTGNGSTDGPFVFTGFRPRWILIRRSSTTGSWMILDAARNTYNLVNHKLAPNSSAAEDDDSIVGSGDKNSVDFLSNGFKLRSTNGETNGSTYTFIYACFAESPFKYSRAR